MERQKLSTIYGIKGLFRGPRSRFAICFFLFAISLPLYSQTQTELGSEGDLTVLGTGGTALDPNTEIKGFTVFGSTQTAYTGAVIGPGNVVVNGVLAVSSGAYFVGNSTFPAAAKIFINDGSPGQLLSKNSGGWLEWFNAGAIGDNLGTHIATQTLNLAGWNMVNASSVNFRSNVFISSASEAQHGGIYVSSNVYIVGFSSAAKYYGDGSTLTGVASAEALGSKIGGSGTADWVAKFQGSGNAITDSSIYDTGSVVVFTNAASSVTIYGKDAVTGYSLVLSSGLNMPNGTMNAGQVQFNPNIAISSEPAAAQGGGVRVSTNIYIVGFSSAAKYYGDGSSLTGIGGTLSGGQAPKLPYWTAANTLGNSMLSQDSGGLTVMGSTLTVQGSAFSVGGSTLAVKAGNVGIGTASPAALLSLEATGTAAYSPTAQGGSLTDSDMFYVANNNPSSEFSSMYFGVRTSLSAFGRISLLRTGATVGAFTFQLRNGGGVSPELMRIDSGGNVGIGTSSPAQRLDVNGNAAIRATNMDAHVMPPALDVNGAWIRLGDGLSSQAFPNGLGIKFHDTNFSHASIKYSPSAYRMDFGRSNNDGNSLALDGAAAMQLDFQNSNVGIGRLDAATRLGVQGDADSTYHLLVSSQNASPLLAVNKAGNVGIGTESPGAKLDVAGIVRSTFAFSPGDGVNFQSSRYMYDNSANYRTAFSSNVYIVGYSSAAKYYGDGSGLTGISGDNLGSHNATQRLNMAGNQIVGVSSLTIIAPDTIASSLWVSTSAVTPHLYISTGGNVGISTNAPEGRLDVKAAGSAATDMAQIWRKSDGAIVSSMSATGVLMATKFVGDGSALTGITGAADNLGNHVATTTLNMAGFDLVNVSSVNYLPNVFMSSATAAQGGGVYISSNVYIGSYSSGAQ